MTSQGVFCVIIWQTARCLFFTIVMCVFDVLLIKGSLLITPGNTTPPSNRHHQNNGDCLEGKWENYQVCSVQYCVQQLCTVQCTHVWTDLTVIWIGFCFTGPISLCLDSFLCTFVFRVPLYIACFSIVTWWDGPGWIAAWSLGPLLPSVIWHCWLGYLTHKSPFPIWPIQCLVGRQSVNLEILKIYRNLKSLLKIMQISRNPTGSPGNF